MSIFFNKYISKWRELSGFKLFLFYVLHYTLLFFLLKTIIFMPFAEAGKSFIWSNDAIGSYFPLMIYISQTVREGIKAVLDGNLWLPPLYNFSAGAVSVDLQLEPLQWLSILWPWDEQVSAYDFLVLLRFYLAGLTFSLMGFYFKQKALPILIGAISYIFCGDFLYAGITHPWFFAPAILLPLLIIGVERILIGKPGFLFAFIVFLSLIGSLYLSCMLAILIFIYILVRLFNVYKEAGLTAFGKTFGRAVFWGIIGILLSGLVTIPTVLQMMGTGRIGRDVGELLHYTLLYYEYFITSFIITPTAVSSWTYLGFSVLSVPAVLMLFFDKCNDIFVKSLKMIFIILTIMMCLPAVAYVMSGFNDISNRWCYAYALCISSIIMFELPKLKNANSVILAKVTAGVFTYILCCYFVIRNKYFEEPFWFLFIAMLILVCCFLANNKGRKWFLPFCLILTCVSVCYSANIKYSPGQQNYVSEFIDKDQAYSLYESRQYGSLGHSEKVKNDTEFFRVMASHLAKCDTQMPFYWDLNGLTFFANGSIDSYIKIHEELQILQRAENNCNYGIDTRAPLLSLMNIKYYAIQGNMPIPYGFVEVDRVNKDIIFENKYFLPLGYTYDSYITKNDFEHLESVEKQEIMLNSVVIDNNTDLYFDKNTDLDIKSKEITIDNIEMSGLTWQDGTLIVDEENATIKLTFESLPNEDIYLRVVNLDLTSGRSYRRWNLGVMLNDIFTYARFQADAYLYAHGMKTQVIYLGNSPEGYTTCTLTFPQKGTFILDDLEIWCQPMDNYAAQIEALRAEALENVETNWRGLTGTVDLSKDKIMCFGIPYEKSWSVYVDGEKRELMQANIGLMAVELESGYHNIELKYRLPGMTAGIIMSFIGVLAVCWIVIYNHRNKILKRAK